MILNGKGFGAASGAAAAAPEKEAGDGAEGDEGAGNEPEDLGREADDGAVVKVVIDTCQVVRGEGLHSTIPTLGGADDCVSRKPVDAERVTRKSDWIIGRPRTSAGSSTMAASSALLLGASAL